MAKKTFDSSAVMPSQEAVAQLAHEIWEREGRPEGRALEHWFRAISELKAQSEGQSRMTELNTAIAQTSTPKRSRSRAASDKRFQSVS